MIKNYVLQFFLEMVTAALRASCRIHIFHTSSYRLETIKYNLHTLTVSLLTHPGIMFQLSQ